MMAFAYSGICYQSPEAALSAFVKDIPKADPSGINTFASLPSITGTGQISWSINHQAFSGDVRVTRSGIMQLPACTVESLDQWPVQSILFYAALFFAAFMGFRTGFRP